MLTVIYNAYILDYVTDDNIC